MFPRAFQIVATQQRTATLSNRFHSTLVAAGLAAKRPHESTGKGRAVKRNLNQISFHALRHTATSLMKNAGISPAIVQEFIGHESSAISQNYTHIEASALKKAADSMPDVLGTKT